MSPKWSHNCYNMPSENVLGRACELKYKFSRNVCPSAAKPLVSKPVLARNGKRAFIIKNLKATPSTSEINPETERGAAIHVVFGCAASAAEDYATRGKAGRLPNADKISPIFFSAVTLKKNTAHYLQNAS